MYLPGTVFFLDPLNSFCKFLAAFILFSGHQWFIFVQPWRSSGMSAGQKALSRGPLLGATPPARVNGERLSWKLCSWILEWSWLFTRALSLPGRPLYPGLGYAKAL